MDAPTEHPDLVDVVDALCDLSKNDADQPSQLSSSLQSLLRLTSNLIQDIDQAKRLRKQAAAYLTPANKTWIDLKLKSADQALESVSLLVNPVYNDHQRSGSIQLRTRVRLALDRDKVEEFCKVLTSSHLALSAAMPFLSDAESRKRFVEPEPYDPDEGGPSAPGIQSYLKVPSHISYRRPKQREPSVVSHSSNRGLSSESTWSLTTTHSGPPVLQLSDSSFQPMFESDSLRPGMAASQRARAPSVSTLSEDDLADAAFSPFSLPNVYQWQNESRHFDIRASPPEAPRAGHGLQPPVNLVSDNNLDNQSLYSNQHENSYRGSIADYASTFSEARIEMDPVSTRNLEGSPPPYSPSGTERTLDEISTMELHLSQIDIGSRAPSSRSSPYAIGPSLDGPPLPYPTTPEPTDQSVHGPPAPQLNTCQHPPPDGLPQENESGAQGPDEIPDALRPGSPRVPRKPLMARRGTAPSASTGLERTLSSNDLQNLRGSSVDSGGGESERVIRPRPSWMSESAATGSRDKVPLRRPRIRHSEPPAAIYELDAHTQWQVEQAGPIPIYGPVYTKALPISTSEERMTADSSKIVYNGALAPPVPMSPEKEPVTLQGAVRASIPKKRPKKRGISIHTVESQGAL